MEKTPRTWTAQDAKAKFSEVLDGAEDGTEQIITRHGKKIAKVVPIKRVDQDDDFGARLVDMLSRSPLRGSGLKIKRSGKVMFKQRKLDL